MAFKFHPPTRTHCDVCEAIADIYDKPLISKLNGKASSADNFPIHNWYNFVLGYSPEFPSYIIEREGATKDTVIADPFMGSGTTNVAAKQHGLTSYGIDANDYFDFTARTKLNWSIDTKSARKIEKEILTLFEKELSDYKWPDSSRNESLELFGKKDFRQYVDKERINALPDRYISDAPLAKLLILKKIVSDYSYPNEDLKNLFVLAFTTVTLPASNISYGPGFGVKKAKVDADVYSLFKNKIDRMITDLENTKPEYREVRSETYLGDARKMTEHFKPSSIDLMITSPPYPGDHEYTKHSKIELIFMNFATDLDEFRVIKKRMLRGSTTNIYKGDSEGELVKDIASIKEVTDEIAKRLEADGATSGFEKLYTKLVWEYFGGMFNVFKEASKVLKPGGKFVLLVSDSHAFKMVHIRTAEILAEVAVKAGLVNPHIELWQHKGSTSHKYNLFEEVLTVERPV